MSALGQKQTLRRFQLMSALPPKADINAPVIDVHFVPKADIVAAFIRKRVVDRQDERKAAIHW